ncbi:MAG TPA: hypothetical protein VNN80_23805 [Polyangiaceae bacterium]|jgi:hypothetical protein|nr:hypothetical protein [Polyangiaceae bacterium]
MTATYDVFMSYSHGDKERVLPGDGGRDKGSGRGRAARVRQGQS